MNIAIIGYGNVGKALASGWVRAGHTIIIGVRNPDGEKYQSSKENGMQVLTIGEAVDQSEVILIAIPAQAVSSFAQSLSGVEGKIFIDATNSVFMKEKEYPTGAHIIKKITGAEHVVKGFNTTGFENMKNPTYKGNGIDMFTAGDSEKGKEIMQRLSTDLGFESCHDFGGDDKFELIEQFALVWINLAIMQGEGREMAFKILKR